MRYIGPFCLTYSHKPFHFSMQIASSELQGLLQGKIQEDKGLVFVAYVPVVSRMVFGMI